MAKSIARGKLWPLLPVSTRGTISISVTDQSELVGTFKSIPSALRLCVFFLPFDFPANLWLTRYTDQLPLEFPTKNHSFLTGTSPAYLYLTDRGASCELAGLPGLRHTSLCSLSPATILLCLSTQELPNPCVSQCYHQPSLLLRHNPLPTAIIAATTQPIPIVCPLRLAEEV